MYTLHLASHPGRGRAYSEPAQCRVNNTQYQGSRVLAEIYVGSVKWEIQGQGPASRERLPMTAKSSHSPGGNPIKDSANQCPFTL